MEKLLNFLKEKNLNNEIILDFIVKGENNSQKFQS